MSKVFVLDTTKQPLGPVHPGRARLLLKEGKAAVYRRFPFTLILKRALEAPTLPPLRLKIDPGSQTTGLAILNDATGEVVWAAELTHRGKQIKHSMDRRRTVRRSQGSATPAIGHLAPAIAAITQAGLRLRWRAGSRMCSRGSIV